MILYHGSEKIIRIPQFGAGKPYNDYGQGFYCTESKTLAQEWSVDAARDGFVNSYELDAKGLRILNLNGGEYTVLHWLAILLENRQFSMSSRLAREAKAYLLEHFSVPYKEADVIIGYRADDSYFSFASDFVNGTISVSQLEKAMYLGKLGEQVALRSRRAFDRIRFLEYEPVDAAEWYPKKEKRDQKARADYFRTDREGWTKGELYMPKILDEEIGADDSRIQRIVY